MPSGRTNGDAIGRSAESPLNPRYQSKHAPCCSGAVRRSHLRVDAEGYDVQIRRFTPQYGEMIATGVEVLAPRVGRGGGEPLRRDR